MKGRFKTFLLFGLLAVVGLGAASRVHLLFENRRFGNSLTIRYHLPNSTPKLLEQQVTAPLEGVIGTLQGVEHVKSSSDYNQGTISIDLEEGIDPDFARFEVSSAIRQIYRKLPSTLSYPSITVNDGTKSWDTPLMTIQLSGMDTSSTLRDFIQRTIKPKLAQIAGIRAIEIYGGASDELILTYDPTWARVLSISKDDIVKALHLANFRTGLGRIQESGGVSRQLILPSTLDSTDFRSTIISTRSNRIINIPDLIAVEKRAEQPTSFFRVNGNTAIQILIFPKPLTNYLQTAASIRSCVKKLKDGLPSDYSLKIDHDSTKYMDEGIHTLLFQLGSTLSLILILTSIIFRSWKALLIIMSSVVLCVLMSLATIYLCNIQVSIFILPALIPLIGVVGGNVATTYYWCLRFNDKTVIIAILGSALASAATFSATLMLPSEIQYYSTTFIALTIIFQSSSACVCMWFIPAITESLRVPNSFKRQNTNQLSLACVLYTWGIPKIYPYRGIIIFCCVASLGIPFFLLPRKLETGGNFAKLYNGTLGNEWYLENIRPYVDLGTGGILRPFWDLLNERQASLTNDETSLVITAGLPNSSPIGQMNAALRQIEQGLSQFNKIDRFLTRVYNGQQGMIVVYFKKPFDQGVFPYKVKEEVIRMSNEMSGIDWQILGVGQGFNVTINERGAFRYNIVLKGYNLEELERLTLNLRKILSKHPRVRDIDANYVPGSISRKQLFTYGMREESLYWVNSGVSKQMLFDNLSLFDLYPTASFYVNKATKRIGIKIQPIIKGEADLSTLRTEPIPITDSIELKVAYHVDITKNEVTPSIHREDQNYIRQISFEFIGSDVAGKRYISKTTENFLQDIPLGYTVEKQAAYGMELIKARQYAIILLVLFIVFVTSVVMFESFRKPVALLAAITMSLIGVCGAFLLSNTAFDIGGYTSFLFVVGTVSFPLITIITRFNILTKKTTPTLATFFLAFSNGGIALSYFFAYLTISIAPIFVLGVPQSFWQSLGVGTFGGVFACLLSGPILLPLLLIAPRQLGATK